MTGRPDVTAELADGETLLWQGHPKPGRPISRRANVIGALLYAGTGALLLFAWWLEIYWGHVPAFRLTVYGVIGTAAFLTFVGLRVTLLDRRRARARDSRTAYAITDRRVLVLAGPYRSELDLGAGVQVEVKAGGLNVERQGTRLRLDRLVDARAAQDILLAQIGGKP